MLKLLAKIKDAFSNETLPAVRAEDEITDLTPKEQEFIKKVGMNITKYGTDGPDKHLAENTCEEISDFIGDNGAIFLVKRNGKAYYSANFSYPEDAGQAQLERIFVRMSMIVREQIEGEEGEIVQTRSITKERDDLIEANRAGALT